MSSVFVPSTQLSQSMDATLPQGVVSFSDENRVIPITPTTGPEEVIPETQPQQSATTTTTLSSMVDEPRIIPVTPTTGPADDEDMDTTADSPMPMNCAQTQNSVSPTPNPFAAAATMALMASNSFTKRVDATLENQKTPPVSPASSGSGGGGADDDDETSGFGSQLTATSKKRKLEVKATVAVSSPVTSSLPAKKKKKTDENAVDVFGQPLATSKWVALKTKLYDVENPTRASDIGMCAFIENFVREQKKRTKAQSKRADALDGKIAELNSEKEALNKKLVLANAHTAVYKTRAVSTSKQLADKTKTLNDALDHFEKLSEVLADSVVQKKKEKKAAKRKVAFDAKKAAAAEAAKKEKQISDDTEDDDDIIEMDSPTPLAATAELIAPVVALPTAAAATTTVVVAVGSA